MFFVFCFFKQNKHAICETLSHKMRRLQIQAYISIFRPLFLSVEFLKKKSFVKRKKCRGYSIRLLPCLEWSISNLEASKLWSCWQPVVVASRRRILILVDVPRRLFRLVWRLIRRLIWSSILIREYAPRRQGWWVVPSVVLHQCYCSQHPAILTQSAAVPGVPLH